MSWPRALTVFGSSLAPQTLHVRWVWPASVHVASLSVTLSPHSCFSHSLVPLLLQPASPRVKTIATTPKIFICFIDFSPFLKMKFKSNFTNTYKLVF